MVARVQCGLEDLSRLPGWEAGRVELAHNAFFKTSPAAPQRPSRFASMSDQQCRYLYMFLKLAGEHLFTLRFYGGNGDGVF